ncbi:hypothetical protein HN51_061346 [Arachis hypogaea]|nr:uncharacterized protein DS421_11g321750 [Arachis hypogaea]
MHAKDSVVLLCSQDIDFARNVVAKISSVYFAKLVAASELFNKALTWVTFHGRNAYDVKHVMRFYNGLYGNLEKVADIIQVD